MKTKKNRTVYTKAVYNGKCDLMRIYTYYTKLFYAYERIRLGDDYETM